MKTIALALLLAITANAFAADPVRPEHVAEVVCYLGKLGSGSFCSMVATQPSDRVAKEGSLKCGLNGKVSLIEWSFVERRGGKDVYRFSRRFPDPSAESPAQTKEIHFGGERLILFEDTFQVIVIQPLKR